MSELTDIHLDKIHNTLAYGIGMVVLLLIAILGVIIFGAFNPITIGTGIAFIVLAIMWQVSTNKINRQYNAIIEEKEE